VHFEDGWFGDTKSSTINFIAAILTYIVLAFLIYQGKPWKKPIWTNKPLFVVLLVNAVLILVISFTTSSLSSF
jgi:magnesium-transporting ATPase (P-type)